MRSTRSTRTHGRFAAAVLLSMVLAALFASCSSNTNAGSGPPLTITPGPYHDQEYINLSVGPNHVFKPHSHINILECADKDGTKANLPTSVNTCDGNTIQGPTVLIGLNGSFSIRGYQLFALPNVTQLGESTDGEPVCNAKAMCVLYIGENQINFRWPKMFSQPFLIEKSKS
jgi:hypothetical protein